jgi:hypothetical protein
MKLPLAFGVIAALGLFGCVAATPDAGQTDEEQTAKPEALNAGQVASLAGTSGRVTTLAAYGDGTAHPGVNAVDIGAPGGSLVFHQLDYIPPSIAGGYVTVEEVHEPGRCSQWSPGDAHYNGSKIVVNTSFYDADGNLVGTHRAAFQHVDPHYDNINNTWNWNNATADRPLFPDGAVLTYNNGREGGLFLGWVHAVGAPIYNGPNGYLCTDGSHLHQEGEGVRAAQRYVGEQLTERYSDIHYF